MYKLLRKNNVTIGHLYLLSGVLAKERKKFAMEYFAEEGVVYDKEYLKEMLDLLKHICIYTTDICDSFKKIPKGYKYWSIFTEYDVEFLLFTDIKNVDFYIDVA